MKLVTAVFALALAFGVGLLMISTSSSRVFGWWVGVAANTRRHAEGASAGMVIIILGAMVGLAIGAFFYWLGGLLS